MKLYEKLPDAFIFKGRKYRLNLDFRNVIRMMDILADDNLTPEAREYLAVKCICKRPKPGMLKEIHEILFPEVSKGNGQRITDFGQDADMIRAAFRQVYGIDLYRDKLHWYEFNCLLSSLPEGSKYTNVLSIRAREIPVPTKYNADERNWLIQAKAEYALKLSEKEQEKNYQQSVKNISNALLALAGKGGK